MANAFLETLAEVRAAKAAPPGGAPSDDGDTPENPFLTTLREVRSGVRPATDYDPGFLPTAIRIGSPIAGSVLGTVLAPVAGTYFGGGLGGVIGEILAQEIEEYAGMREGKNVKRIGLEGLLGSLPMLGRFPGVQSTLMRVFLRGGEAAAVSAGAFAATDLVETGELPTPKELLQAAGLGGVLGGFGGAIEARTLRRIAPTASKTILGKKPPQPVIRKVTSEEDAEIIRKLTSDDVVFGKTGPVGDDPLPAEEIVRRGVRTLQKSPYTDPRVKAGLESIAKTTRQHTFEQIQRAVWRANDDYAARLAEYVGKDFKVQSGDDMALGLVLMEKTQNRGDWDAAVAVSKKIGTGGTDMGRGVQFFSQFNRLRPQGLLVWAQKMWTKAGKGDIPGDLAKEWVEEATRIQGMVAGRERDIAQTVLLQRIQDSVPASFKEKAIEAWKAGLLSGIGTQVVNVSSNSFNIVFRGFVERPIAAGIEFARTAGGLRRPREIFLRENVDAALAMWHGTKSAFRKALDAFTYETAIETSKLDVGRRAIGGTTGRIVRIPFRFLSAADIFFKELVYDGEMSRQAYRTARKELKSGTIKDGDFRARISDLLQNPTDEMFDKANFEKLYQVFQAPLGKAGKAFGKLLRDTPELQLIIPFYTTPVNIAKFGLERTPLGFFRTSIRAFRKKEGGTFLGSISGSETSEEFAKSLLSTALSVGIVTYAAEGLITGSGPVDADARRVLYETGWKPYAFKIGNTYHSYARIEPLATVVGMIADYAELGDLLEKESAINQITFSISQNLLSKTFVRGLSQAIGALGDPENRGPRFIQNLTGSAVPTLVKDVARAFDPVLRRPEPDQLLFSPIASRTPGLTQFVPPLRGLWGKPVVIQSSPAERLVSPFFRGEVNMDFTTREVARVGRATGRWPGSPRRSIGAFEIPQKVYDRYVEDSGALAHQKVRAVVSGLGYNVKNDADRAEAIIGAFSDARREVRDRMGITSAAKFERLEARAIQGLGPLL